jgi:hypothetical protein
VDTILIINANPRKVGRLDAYVTDGQTEPHFHLNYRFKLTLIYLWRKFG